MLASSIENHDTESNLNDTNKKVEDIVILKIKATDKIVQREVSLIRIRKLKTDLETIDSMHVTIINNLVSQLNVMNLYDLEEEQVASSFIKDNMHLFKIKSKKNVVSSYIYNSMRPALNALNRLWESDRSDRNVFVPMSDECITKSLEGDESISNSIEGDSWHLGS